MIASVEDGWRRLDLSAMHMFCSFFLFISFTFVFSFTSSWTHDDRGFFYSRYPQPAEFAAPTAEQQADPEFKRGTETSSVKNHQVYYHALSSTSSDCVKSIGQMYVDKMMSASFRSDGGSQRTNPGGRPRARAVPTSTK